MILWVAPALCLLMWLNTESFCRHCSLPLRAVTFCPVLLNTPLACSDFDSPYLTSLSRGSFVLSSSPCGKLQISLSCASASSPSSGVHLPASFCTASVLLLDGGSHRTARKHALQHLHLSRCLLSYAEKTYKSSVHWGRNINPSRYEKACITSSGEKFSVLTATIPLAHSLDAAPPGGVEGGPFGLFFLSLEFV